MLEAQRRYLDAVRQGCAARRDAHPCQLAAVEREAAIAADAPDLGAYLRVSGGMFELTRSAWLDRLVAHARVAAAVGDPWRARAAAAEVAHAVAAADAAGWGAALAAGAADGVRHTTAGREALSAWMRLLLGLTALRSTPAGALRDERRTQAGEALAAVSAADPAFALDALARPYALRIPWTGCGCQAAKRWIAELDGAGRAEAADARTGPSADPAATGPPDGARPAEEALAAVEADLDRWRRRLGEAKERSPAADPLTDVPDPAAPYRAVLDAATGDDRASRAMRQAARALVDAAQDAPTAPDALARFHTDGLLTALAAAPLRAAAEERLARRQLWPDPLLEHHWRTILAALDACRTPTEVELVSVHASACLEVEGDWNGVLLATLLAPARTALAFASNPVAATREAAAGAAEAAQALTGLAAADLLDLPRVAKFLRDVVAPLSAPEADPDIGALEGEAGFEVLQEARLLAAAGTRLTGEDTPATVRGLLGQAGARLASSGRPLPVRLWDEEMELADLERGLARPARPHVPGSPVVARPEGGL